jgi:zinc protease
MSVAARHGLQAVRRELENGVVVLAKQARTTPAVTIQASLHAGSAYDPPGREGLAHFVSRLIDRGTAARSADEIADELDRRGVSLAIGVTRHQLSLTCTCLTDDVEPVFEVMADIMRNPVFPESEIETRRGEVLTAIQQDADNPAVVASETLMERLYPAGHPYGRRARGTSATVRTFDRTALARFHRERCAAGCLSVAIVGDVDAARALELAGRFLADWNRSTPVRLVPPSVPESVGRDRTVTTMMNKAQADIAYGFVTVARKDPRYYAAAVMNNVLGQYALGGRLGDQIRERLGMAYYIFSSLDANIGRGPLVVRAGVDPRNVDRTIDAIDAEVRSISSRGMTDREVADSKQYLIASIPRTLETNVAIAAFLQLAEFFELGVDYDVRMPDLIAQVTGEQANQAARELLNTERATIAIAGPYEAGDQTGEAA